MPQSLKTQLDIDQNKLAAAGSYFWCFSVIFLFARRDSAYVQFHAKQATLLFVLSVIFWLVPYLYILNILVFAAMAVGFITAVQGEYYGIPVIASFINNKEEVKTLPASIWNIVKHYVRETRYIFRPRKQLDVFRELTNEKIQELQRSIQSSEKNIQQELQNLEFYKSQIEEIQKHSNIFYEKNKEI